MKIDLYGSKYSLIPLLKMKENSDISINKVYLGTTIESQFGKAEKINFNILNKRMNYFEKIEIMTDLQKTFRKTYQNTDSKCIIIDFYNEAYDLIVKKNTKLTASPTLKKYQKYENKFDEDVLKHINALQKYSLIEDQVETFIKKLDGYEIVVINKVRVPKLLIDNNSEELTNNFIEVNRINSLIESYEDYLNFRLNDINVIPLYDKDVSWRYFLTNNYNKYFKENLEKILYRNTLSSLTSF